MYKIQQNKTNLKENYVGYITYKDLIKYAYLKPLIVNRLTDDSRIKEMEKYIKEEGSTYPPLVLALDSDCIWTYNDKENKLYINKGIEGEEKISDKNKLVIIDGQHRFLSIKKALKDKDENSSIEERKQAIFIVGNLNDLEQRNLFMDINDNMKRVSSVSRRFFEVGIANYISLRILKEMNIIKKVNLKNDQVTNMYPYKFILSGNKILFEDLDIESFEYESMFDELKIYTEKAVEVWTVVLSFIEKNTDVNLGFIKKECSENYKSIKTEIFIKALFNTILEENPGCIEKGKEEVKKVFEDKLKYIVEHKYFEHDNEINRYDKKEKENLIVKYIRCCEENKKNE